jgi:hypothetical protein
MSLRSGWVRDIRTHIFQTQLRYERQCADLLAVLK